MGQHRFTLWVTPCQWFIVRIREFIEQCVAIATGLEDPSVDDECACCGETEDHFGEVFPVAPLFNAYFGEGMPITSGELETLEKDNTKAYLCTPCKVELWSLMN
jgi:hypothetical protein